MSGEELLKEALAKLAKLEVKKDKVIKEQLYELVAQLRQDFLKVEIEVLEARKTIAIDCQEYSEAAYYLDKERKLRKKLADSTHS